MADLSRTIAVWRARRPSLLALLLVLGWLLPAAPALAGEEVPPAIHNSFEQFSKGWMARLDVVGQQNLKTLRSETATDGRLIGRYICYGPECLREIRPTGAKATPFVGILRYPQKTMEKEGETPQQLRQHPGRTVGESEVTEIFRYTGGRWVY